MYMRGFRDLDGHEWSFITWTFPRSRSSSGLEEAGDTVTVRLEERLSE
jgi:hypothetical protein